MNLKIQKNIQLKTLTWWKVGGEADFFCLPSNLKELQEACQFARDQKLSTTILSGGTNILVSDQGIRGLVIHFKKLSHLKTYLTQDELRIEALAGTPKYELFKIFTQHQLAPAFFLCGLPGDVGGGVVMNAGVGHDLFPYEFSQIVHALDFISCSNSQVQSLKKQDLQWNYRSCEGLGSGIIYKVYFKWPLKKEDHFHSKLRQVNKKRRGTQPLNQPTCGSVFKNPPGEKSGRLIEKSGLKGFRIGDAEVSSKHANFIINKGRASAQDIHRVICHVQEKVRKDFNISLEPEIHYLGDWN